MSYDRLGTPGEAVTIPVPWLDDYDIVLRVSQSASFKTYTEIDDTVALNYFELPELKDNLYYRVVGTKNGASVILQHGRIFLPEEDDCH